MQKNKNKNKNKKNCQTLNFQTETDGREEVDNYYVIFKGSQLDAFSHRP